MGLIDVLNGMQNGPRGARAASSGSSSGGGMSPHHHGDPRPACLQGGEKLHQPAGHGTAALEAPAPAKPGFRRRVGRLLKNVLGGNTAPTPAGGSGGSGGGLNDSSKAASAVCSREAPRAAALSGGLNDLLKQLQEAGQGDVAKSWVGNGPNKTISPNDLASALGADQIKALSAHSGIVAETI